MSTDETNERTEGNGIAAPYVSFATLKNAVERMGREGGVPSQVDRSYLANLPGSTQTQLIGAMKWLDLVDDQLKPRPMLEKLVEGDEAGRKETFEVLLRERYPKQVGLPPLATQGQLEAAFRDMGLSGSTMRKAVAFYLAAAKFAELPLSPHFKTPRASTPPGERRPRRPRQAGTPSASGDGPAAVPAPHASRAHHPLIEGLIQELPPVGAAFPQAKQEDWLQLAKVTFRMIYRTDEGPRHHDEEPDVEDE